jgi:uncharacterized membrane protein YhaH (DUF805 family)
MSELLSLDGRINRVRYFVRVLIITLIADVGLGIGAFGGHNIVGLLSGLLGGAIAIAGVVIAAFQAVKRLHDLDRPSMHYWLLLIPFYNLYLALVLLLKKGTEGTNRFGPDPLALT